MSETKNQLVSYELKGAVATIAMDDGKVNVMSLGMFKELNAALDRAAADKAVVILTGRTGVFSAGFDLPVLRAGGSDSRDMIVAGFKFATRVFSFPLPVVVACTGHALAMGLFAVLAADYRIGVSGPFKLGANEVAIGLTMPYFAIEMCRQRLQPAFFNRAVINAEIFDPEQAMQGGILDRVVLPEQLSATASGVAQQLASLHLPSHAATKLRVREHTLKTLRSAIDADDAAWLSARA